LQDKREEMVIATTHARKKKDVEFDKLLKDLSVKRVYGS
jgi:hypothetical protein